MYPIHGSLQSPIHGSIEGPMNGVLRRPTVGRFLAPSNPLDTRGEEAGWKATLGEGNGGALKRGENSLGREAGTTSEEDVL